MNPRLKSSKKWTAFPKEYSDQIHAVFNENFAQYLQKAELIIEGRIYPAEIMLRVGFLEAGRLSQANFEISVGYSAEKKDTLQRIHNCIDAAASLMLEYFEGQKEDATPAEFPYIWKEISFEGFKVFFQFTTENSNLEAEANRLLGLAEGEELFSEEEDIEDALSIAEVREDLKVPENETDPEVDSDDESEADDDDTEEDEGPQGPRMFSGKPKKKGELH